MAVALPNVTVKWVQPSFSWDQEPQVQTTPFLTEFASDQFMPQFLDMMAGKTPINLSKPTDTLQAPVVDGSQNSPQQPVYKLYMPFHRRYYLVTGSLVCRHFGLPDHTVNRKNGEKVSFLLRRLIVLNNVPTEHGWIDKGPHRGWQPVAAGKVLPDEERLPMHPVKVQPQPLSGTPGFKDARAQASAAANQRVIYHGYVPVASREKYLTPVTNAAQLIQDEIMNPPANTPILPDPRLDEVTTRVITPWFQLFEAANPANPSLPPSRFNLSTTPTPPGPADPSRPSREDASLFVLLDLGDFLQKKLPEVFQALTSTTGANLPTDGTFTQRQALLDELRKITVTMYQNGSSFPIPPTLPLPSASAIALGDAFTRLAPYFSPAQGKESEPPDAYDVTPGFTSNFIDSFYLAPPPPYPPGLYQVPAQTGTLYTLYQSALTEDRTIKTNNKQDWLTVPDELKEVIKVEGANGDVYFLRLVYEHAPCDPVLSDPTPAFTFARFFDPDAPARPIRIELPSIKPKDLRKYKRGVGLQFSPELNSVINRVNKGMLTGGGLAGSAPGGGLGISFICTFSIAITFLVAIIVMFIFLILFNIIFWWLPLIFICFPIPRKK